MANLLSAIGNPMQLHNDTLLSELQTHTRALAAGIGPRPPASGAEEAAFAYIRAQLGAFGVADCRTLRCPAPRTRAASLWLPLALTALHNLAPWPVVSQATPEAATQRRLTRLGGAVLALGAAQVVYDALRGDRPNVTGRLQPTSVQLGVVRAANTARHTLVLTAPVDSPPALRTMTPAFRLLGTAALAAPLLNSVSNAVAAAFGEGGGRRVRAGTAVGMAVAGAVAWSEARRAHTPGAVDNASGVAVLLAAARHFAANPPPHTDVWLAFTGAATSGNYGLHALLDSYGADLTGAHFLNFERVGAPRLTLGTAHTGLSHVTSYTPAPHTLALADTACNQHPVLGVEQGTIPGVDQTATLRRRGYNGLTLTGYDPVSERPLAWHALDDVPAGVSLEGAERAVRFIEAFAAVLDAEPA